MSTANYKIDGDDAYSRSAGAWSSATISNGWVTVLSAKIGKVQVISGEGIISQRSSIPTKDGGANESLGGIHLKKGEIFENTYASQSLYAKRFGTNPVVFAVVS